MKDLASDVDQTCVCGHDRANPTHFLQGFDMKTNPLLSSALASVLALGLVHNASAHDDMAKKDKEKCFGIVKAGENSCANLSGTHSCAGEAKDDKSPAEWKLVAKGTCAKLGGLDAEQAKAAVAKASKG